MPDTSEKLLDSVNETARITRTALLFLLVVALYLLIIVGTTTDLMLLRGEIVALPLMEVGVPVVAFYIAAPFIFLLLHINLLLRLSQLAETIRRWKENSDGLEDEHGALVFPFDFARLLLYGKHRWVLWVVVVIQIVLLPIVVLLVLQMSFLAYQSSGITLWHQGIVTADLVSLFLFAFSVRRTLAERKSDRNNVLKIFVQIFSAILVLFFTWTIAVVPNIEQEMVVPETVQMLVATMMKMKPDDFCSLVDGSQKRPIQQLSACIFADWWEGYPLTAYRPFRRYLKVEEQSIALKEAPPEIVVALIRQTGESSPDIPCQHIEELDLRKRQLNYARFQESQFRCVNLQGAKLHGADLRRAKLHGANLRSAKLHGAYLQGAELHGANLSYANLHGADLSSAELHGANLLRAKLYGADLESAKLHGANLFLADLYGANLWGAELYDADLYKAKLHGADLGEAILKNTKFFSVDWEKPEHWDKKTDNISQALKKRGVTDAEINNGLSRIEKSSSTTFGFIPPKAPSKDDCVFHSGEGPFEGWSPPAKDCDLELISSVVEVACSDQWTAKGIVNRVISNKNINLINALLMEDCLVLKSYREELKELNE